MFNIYLSLSQYVQRVYKDHTAHNLGRPSLYVLSHACSACCKEQHQYIAELECSLGCFRNEKLLTFLSNALESSIHRSLRFSNASIIGDSH